METPDFKHPQTQKNTPSEGEIVITEQSNDPSYQISALQGDVERIKNTRINLNTDIIGLFETVSAVPTGIPTGPWQQLKFYSNGATYRLYIFDATNRVWRYATLT